MSTHADNTNGWGEWRNHILKEMERISAALDGIKEEQATVRVELAEARGKLKVFAAGIASAVGILSSLAGHFIDIWGKK